MPHRDKHGGGRPADRSTKHGAGAKGQPRAVAKHGDTAKLRALRKAVRQKVATKEKRRGQIDLDDINQTNYKKDGCNVQLSPIPKLWTHDDLRRLLQRVNAPCPIAWNLQAAKGLAWIDYDSRKNQRAAIAALHNLQMPNGLTLTATPVDVEKKKKPKFYRDCDDGRVLPSDLLPQPPQRPGKRPAEDNDVVEIKDGEAPAAPVKRVKGRGFAAFAGAVIRPRADGVEDEPMAGPVAAPVARAPTAAAGAPALPAAGAGPADGYHSDSSSSSGASSQRSLRQALATANSALLAKYKVMLKRLTEKKRSKGTDVDVGLSDEEDSA